MMKVQNKKGYLESQRLDVQVRNLNLDSNTLRYPKYEFSLSVGPLSTDMYGRDDKSSFARPSEAITTYIKLNWNIDFESQTISGTCEHVVKILKAGVDEIYFDTRNLTIHGDVAVDSKVRT